MRRPPACLCLQTFSYGLLLHLEVALVHQMNGLRERML